MANPMSWKLLAALLMMVVRSAEGGGVQHSATQMLNSTKPGISPFVIGKRETAYQIYLVTSLIIQAANEKPLTNESLILNIDLSGIDDADEVIYFSEERNQTIGNVVKIKYVDEFEREGLRHVQYHNQSHSMSITLEYFSQSFQQSLASVYLNNIHSYRYILFSPKSLHADSFEKSGLQLKKIDIKADDVAIKNYRVGTRMKNFKLEISNREMFLNSDFGKNLMQSLSRAFHGEIISSTSKKLQKIVRFFENLTLTVHLNTWDDAQQIYAMEINEIEPDLYSPFISQYILQKIFTQLTLKAKTRAVDVKNNLIDWYKRLSMLMRKVPSANNIVFHTGDSSSLEHFLSDFTNQLNASVARPVAIFKTWSITYACDQITQFLNQYHSHDLYFFSFDNITFQSDFLKAALTMPGVGLPRTICLLFPHSITLPEKSISQEQLEVLKKLMDQNNDANARLIFIVEKPDANATDSLSNNLLTMLNKTFFVNSSKRSEYIIEDGPYKLKKSSLNSALNISFQLNGRITTVRELFSPISPAFYELSLGKHVWFQSDEKELIITSAVVAPDTLISGNVYIQRQLPPWPINDDMPLAITLDTPTAIANSIIRCSNPSLNSKIIAINGKRGSGKTVILQKIQYELQSISSSVWTIFIDLPNFFLASRSGEFLSVEKIIQEVVDLRFRDLFWNLVKINPRKIVFLLDGVNEMTSDQETGILNVVSHLFELGVHVVLTGSFRTMELLLNYPNLAINIYDIREMSPEEKHELLKYLWQEQLINGALRDSNDEKTNNLASYVNEFSKKLHDYVKYTVTPLALVMIAEIFKENCSAYLQNKFAEFELPTEAFDKISEKTDLYEKYVDSISESFQNIPNFHRVYSICAFVQIFKSVETQDRESPLLWPISDEIDDAEQQYQTFFTLRSHRPSTSRDYAPGILNHLDIKEFFASKYAEILFSKTGVYSAIDLLESLMKNPAYNSILQYLDSKINTIAMYPILFETFEFTHDKSTELSLALKNVINAGFGNFHQFIFKTLTRAQLINMKDFYRDAEIEFYKPIQTFGELNLREYARISIFEIPPEKFNCTLMCTLVENNMLTSLKSLKTLNIWYDSDSPKYTTYFNNMLDIAVTRPTPNQQLVQFLIENLPTKNFSPNYNSLLIRTVSEVGDGCQPIADYLITLGADPKMAQTSDGRGLLHVAVKWQSLNLLSYIVDELKVNRESTSRSGLTVFAAALDANPCPNFTPSDWWNIMNYLIIHVEGIAETHLESVDLPSTSRLEAATTRLFKAILVDLYSSNLHAFSKQATLNVMTDEELGFLLRYATWNMHPDTLSLRRRLLIKQIFTPYSNTNLSPLEMLLHYQSARSLLIEDRIGYELTVLHLLQIQANKRDDNRPRLRLMKMLIANLYNADDLESLANFLDQGIILTPAERGIMMSWLDQRMSSPIQLIKSPMIQPSNSTSALMAAVLKNQPAFSVVASDAFAKPQYNRLIHSLLGSDPHQLYQKNSAIDVQSAIKNQCSAHPFTSTSTFDWNSVSQFIRVSDDQQLIRIDSDGFLRALTMAQNSENRRTAQQLMEFGRFVTNLAECPNFLTGNSRFTLREIFHYPDLDSYRSNQIMSRIINDIFSSSTRAALAESEDNLQPNPLDPEVHDRLRYGDLEHISALKTSSYSTVRYAASIDKFIRRLHATVTMCAIVVDNNKDAKECIASSSSLAKFTMVDFIVPQLAGYIPLVIMSYGHSTLNHLPMNMRDLLTNRFESEGFGTRIGTGKMIKYGLGTVGALFNIYMMADFSKSLLDCTETASCTSKTMTDLVVALSFTSLSLGATTISVIIEDGELSYPLIGFGLLTLETIILTGNTIRWYSSKYHTTFMENVRICLYSFLFMGIPKDVLALQARADRINDLQKQIVKLLRKSDSPIVAYATGIGRLSKSVWMPGRSTINMADGNQNTTQELSRVLPKAISNILPLCLPKRDTKQPYETQLGTVGSSRYECKNAFAIADKKKWLNRTRDSIVIFDLLHVDRGYIRGSDIANNHFMIWKGLQTLKIVANTDQVSNVFSFQHSQFRGQISLLGMSKYQAIFDMSKLQDIVTILWSKTHQTAFVQVGRESRNNFTIVKQDSPEPYFLFHGRSNRKDIYYCNYHTNSKTNIYDRSITVNGAGGNDHPAQYDDIIDCHTSIVQPWTIIRGSISSETVYTSIVYMDHPPVTNQSLSIAKIIPKKSQFRVIFSNSQFILEKTLQVTYAKKNETLIWHFRHTNRTEMKLHITPFSTINPVNQTQKMPHKMFSKSQTVFFDQYSNATIYPMIKFSKNQTKIAIKFFHIVVFINTTEISEIYSYYHQKFAIKTSSIQEFSFDVSLIHETSRRNYIFGSEHDGRYLIEANTILVAGNGGEDVYVYSIESPQTVYIDNYSSDRIRDTLIIVNDTCSTLDSVNRRQLGNSVDDLGDYLLLKCTNSLKASTTVKHIVVLKYFNSLEWRHLQILWNNKVFVPLPPDWNDRNSMVLNPIWSPSITELALYFSFDESWNGTSLRVTNENSLIMVNEGIMTNPLVVYRIENDVVLTKKFFKDGQDASFLILEKFFINENHTEVAPRYRFTNFRLIFVNDVNDTTTAKVWRIEDIVLQLNSQVNNVTNSVEDIIHNNFVNMNNTSPKFLELVFNFHNKSTDFSSGRIQVLTFYGVKTFDFRIDFYNKDTESNSSLVFYANNITVVVQDWCKSASNRPKYIAFMTSLETEPVMIKHLDTLNCTESDTYKIIDHMENLFLRAQRRLNLIEKINSTDSSRVMKCLGIFFTPHVDREYIYRIFGFSSLVEQHQYIESNCNELLSETNYIDSVTRREMYQMLNDTFELFELGDDLPSPREQTIMATILTEFKNFNEFCWIEFKNSFRANNFVTQSVVDIKNVIRWQQFRDALFEQCSRDSSVREFEDIPFNSTITKSYFWV